MKCALPVGRVSVLGRPACLRLDREPVLAAQFIEVVVRTSANQVGLETTTGRSTTLGSKEVSVVVKGRKAHSLAGLLGTPVAPVNESRLRRLSWLRPWRGWTTIKAGSQRRP